MRFFVLPLMLCFAGTAFAQVESRPLNPCSIDDTGLDGFQLNGWPGGVVPFAFGSNVNPSEQSAMDAAMTALSSVSNVTFVPRTTESDYVYIVDANSNSSYVGRQGGSQTINIYNWNYTYIMAHELLHALGFRHEQSRPDRETYITIQWENIQSGYSHNFNVAGGLVLPTPYDFESIMHYGPYAFSSNGQPTIVANEPYQSQQSLMGNRSSLSTHDVTDLNAAYSIPVLTDLSPSTTNNVTPDEITITGDNFWAVRTLSVGNTTVSFTVVNSNTITFRPPSGLAIDTHDVMLESLMGASAPLPLTFVGTSPPVLLGSSIIVAGFNMQYTCRSDLGQTAALFVALNDTPSVIPGVITFDMGNNFTFLKQWGPAQSTDSAGAATFLVNVPRSISDGTQLYFQCVTVPSEGEWVLPLQPSSRIASTVRVF